MILIYSLKAYVNLHSFSLFDRNRCAIKKTRVYFWQRLFLPSKVFCFWKDKSFWQLHLRHLFLIFPDVENDKINLTRHGFYKLYTIKYYVNIIVVSVREIKISKINNMFKSKLFEIFVFLKWKIFFWVHKNFFFEINEKRPLHWRRA